jgi:hypothetical protein
MMSIYKSANARKKYTIGDLRKIAKARGGKCLSSKYLGATEKHLFECAQGHRWKAIWNSVRRGRWCKKCMGSRIAKTSIENGKYTYGYFFKLVTKKSGNVKSRLDLSQKISAKAKFPVQCDLGHEWHTTIERLKRGAWCKRCGFRAQAERQRDPNGLITAKILAKQNGGKLLSSHYKSRHDPLKWECGVCEEIWKTSLGNILNGTWCPNCSSYKSERFIRKVFEIAYGVKFKKERPAFLKGLELDGFNAELGLAFEHHGEQHYSEGDYFNDKLNNIRLRDRQKVALCKKENIKLIVIPQIGIKTKINDLPKLLSKKLKKFSRFQKTSFYKIDYQYLQYAPRGISAEVQRIFKKNKAKYIHTFDGKESLKVECAYGHTWVTTENRVLRGIWCKKCSHEAIKLKFKKIRLKKIKNLINKNKGKLISNYDGSPSVRLKIKCILKHVWKTSPQKILTGSWCHLCGVRGGNRPKLTIKEMHQIAKKRNGKCLSKTYVDCKTNLTWKCKVGHIWQATPSNVKCGKWCKICGFQKMWKTRKKQLPKRETT